ncbi:hypothetical protein [Parabacteroides sp. PF5-6]|uniref:hypothetical protein n=1 Tax=Parabacteroides sp. PF5-6 TaxID=1742403 RepID=UPI0024075B75|nr:hypothetical protein [Parabacteroides sp. PF5-6]MDF9830292.1 hypothetical protein [Parabacteroides sp. PF5-6]
MTTKRKITRVEGNEPTGSNAPREKFKPTAESQSKANTLRLFAGLSWLVAIVAQVAAIVLLLRQQPINMTLIIVAIVIDLAAAITGALLWKKSNRFDPASKEQKFKFFMQSQLGMVVALIAFLPLIVVILTNKNIDAKQKGILGGIAGVALVIAMLFGVDFAPPSVEQYTEEANRVEWLNEGNDFVYWTKSGTVYHLYSDCSYINTDRTDEIFEGTVANAHEARKITSLCSRCEQKAIKTRNLNESDYVSTIVENVLETEENELKTKEND